MKKILIALTTMALMAGTAAFAAPQRWQGRDERGNGNGHGNRRHQELYREGYQQGERDALRDRRSDSRPNFGNGGDRNAWQRGYEDGFRAGRERRGRNGRWGNGNGNGGYDNGGYGNGGNGGYGNGGYGRGDNRAQQTGYQDGLLEGEKDRRTGHSFRPTASEAYKDADHNYSIVGGDKQSYKNAYRTGYTEGYRRGYGR
jgi:heterogeneous nuclear ribonucleoprotein A1/A3